MDESRCGTQGSCFSHIGRRCPPGEAFWEGFVDYRHGLHRNPYDAVPTQDVECQAWDRGQEAGMRATRTIGSV